jgi:hypothetical protein
MQQKKYPTPAELQNDIEAFKETDQLNYLLSQPFPSHWEKKHPIITIKGKDGKMVPAKYAPIDKIMYLLRKVFGKYRIEILAEGQLFNACYVRARVHYKDPVTGEWDFHDGEGAQSVQLNSGSAASALQEIKSDAVQKALPAAYSYAIKNACEKFGALFGEALNKDAVEFIPFSVTPHAPVATNQIATQETQTTNDNNLNFDPSNL